MTSYNKQFSRSSCSQTTERPQKKEFQSNISASRTKKFTPQQTLATRGTIYSLSDQCIFEMIIKRCFGGYTAHADKNIQRVLLFGQALKRNPLGQDISFD